MITILKGGRVFAPTNLGEKDLLMVAGVIANIGDDITPAPNYGDLEEINVKGKYVVPGFIDQHVHLIGGGGEGGFATRTPEVTLSRITMAGITTVVGCLGSDGSTRHVESLLAKARGLESEGISTYIYTGAYEVPTPTITGSVRRDILLIDKIIGCGEVAISDHRSAEPTREDIMKLAAEARVGGILGGKAGVLHLHVGEGKRKLSMLFDILEESDIPVAQFTPTHLNRNSALLDDGIRFAQMGGMIDLTAGEEATFGYRRGLKPVEAVKHCLAHGISMDQITMSSDGNGSMPSFDEKGHLISLRVAQLSSLHAEFKAIIQEAHLGLPEALKIITVNPAKSLKLYPRKGVLRPGSDADIVVLNEAWEIDYVFAKGRCLVREGLPVVRGMFEE